MSAHPNSPGSQPPAITPQDTARYTAELIESLKKIALQQGQGLLAHLLDLAALEAKSLAKGQAQETRLPE
jgi:hypothetical protein